jgi:hypothetical protein
MTRRRLRHPLAGPPGVQAWLRQLKAGPARRAHGMTGTLAREMGLTDDLVEVDGVVMPAARAGPAWFKRGRYTGLEVLTEEGERALRALDELG